MCYCVSTICHVLWSWKWAANVLNSCILFVLLVIRICPDCLFNFSWIQQSVLTPGMITQHSTLNTHTNTDTHRHTHAHKPSPRSVLISSWSRISYRHYINTQSGSTVSPYFPTLPLLSPTLKPGYVCFVATVATFFLSSDNLKGYFTLKQFI